MREDNDARVTATTSSRLGTRILRRLLIVVATLMALGAVGAVLAWSTPSWWNPPPRDGARSRHADERARSLEQGLAAEFTRVRPDGERWAVRVRDEDANAWLALRLPQWLQHDRELPWPKGVEIVQIRCTSPNRVTLAAKRNGVIWSGRARLVLNDGKLSLIPDGGAIGRLPVPWLSSGNLDDNDGGGGALSAAAFVPELAAPVDATVPLPDGRRVRLLDLEISAGEARLRFETLPR